MIRTGLLVHSPESISSPLGRICFGDIFVLKEKKMLKLPSPLA